MIAGFILDTCGWNACKLVNSCWNQLAEILCLEPAQNDHLPGANGTGHQPVRVFILHTYPASFRFVYRDWAEPQRCVTDFECGLETHTRGETSSPIGDIHHVHNCMYTPTVMLWCNFMTLIYPSWAFRNCIHKLTHVVTVNSGFLPLYVILTVYITQCELLSRSGH